MLSREKQEKSKNNSPVAKCGAARDKKDMQETLISAARRVVRFFNIDQAHGGLVSVDTLQAVHTLDVMVTRESARVDNSEQIVTPMREQTVIHHSV